MDIHIATEGQPDYDLLCQQIQALAEEEPYFPSLLANASALLMAALPDINWVGFYLLRQGRLTLGPFQGRPACIHIELGRGVCGKAAAEDKIQRVADVRLFPGHIACDAASNSEIVLPLRKQGRVAAVLDIDSPRKDRFTAADEAGLAQVARVIEEHMEL